MSVNRFRTGSQPHTARVRLRSRRETRHVRAHASIQVNRWRHHMNSDIRAANLRNLELSGPSPITNPSFLLRVTAMIMLSGFLLLAHGCHGDEDNELFARIISIVTGR
jgi:hypothetical protein